MVHVVAESDMTEQLHFTLKNTLRLFLKLISIIYLWMKIRCLIHDLQSRLEEDLI